MIKSVKLNLKWALKCLVIFSIQVPRRSATMQRDLSPASVITTLCTRIVDISEPHLDEHEAVEAAEDPGRHNYSR